MKLELTNIKYAAFASEETHCFEAKLKVDGKHVADISNDGRGGADYVYWKDGAHVTESRVNDWLKANNAPTVFGDTTIECSLEIWCGDQINAYLTEREVKKAMRNMKSKVLYLKDGKVGHFSWKGVKAIDQRHVDAIKVKYPEHRVLNDLPPKKAEDIIRKAINGDAEVDALERATA